MLKAKLILAAVKFLMGAAAIGIGIWYLSSSLSGASITYTSMNNFLTAAGAQNGDIATVNGCFMCEYISDLFAVIGNATERFWTLMVNNIWIIMVLGVGVFLFLHTAKYIWDNAKKTADLEKPQEHKLEIRAWFDSIWKPLLRVIVVGVMMGALGMGGHDAIRGITKITITPVLYTGAQLSMLATGVSDAAQCNAMTAQSADTDSDILNPVLQPFMCVVGNINSVVLAGAAGGFSMMNFAWMDMGGGAITWIAGLVLVIMFAIIGFDLFFQILSVVFKLVFIIVFMPLLLAAYAFEGIWSRANKLVSRAIEMLVSSAVRIVAITLKVIIIYATVSYAADTYFPGPADGYTAILPPMLGATPQNPDIQTMSVMDVFKTCEQVGLADGEMDKEKFKNCFTARRAQVEREYPGAFDFLDNGWEFMLMMVCLFLLYYYAVSPKIDKLLPAGNIKLPIPGENSDVSSGEQFDIGAWVHDLGQRIWALPVQVTKKITDAMGDKD